MKNCQRHKMKSKTSKTKNSPKRNTYIKIETMIDINNQGQYKANYIRKMYLPCQCISFDKIFW